jgi:hypothetical protein
LGKSSMCDWLVVAAILHTTAEFQVRLQILFLGPTNIYIKASIK